MASARHPLRSRLDLASSASAVRWGRRHTTEILSGWGLVDAVAEDARLIVSELLSNAVQHAGKNPSAPAEGVRCGLLLWLTDRGLTVSVYDDDTRPPVRRSTSTDAERGRGLLLVESLSEAWGYTRSWPTPGKLVWARLPVPEGSADGGGRRLDGTAPPVAVGAVMGW